MFKERVIDFWRLIRKMLSKKPEERPKADKVLEEKRLSDKHSKVIEALREGAIITRRLVEAFGGNYDELREALRGIKDIKVDKDRIQAEESIIPTTSILLIKETLKKLIESKSPYKFDEHDDIISIMIYPDFFVVTTRRGLKLKIFELERKEIVFEYEHDGPVNSVAFSPDGKLIATGSVDKKLRIFYLPSILSTK